MVIHELKRFLSMPNFANEAHFSIYLSPQGNYWLKMQYYVNGAPVVEHLETNRGMLRRYASLNTLLSIFFDAGVHPVIHFSALDHGEVEQ